MGRHLIFLIHATPDVEHRYKNALRKLDGADLVLVNAGSYSSSYVAYGARMKNPEGEIIPRVKAALLPTHKASWEYDTVSAICFSAGYALVREMLMGPDANKLDAVVAIDSIHAGLDPSGPNRVKESDLKMWSNYADRAKNGQVLFWLGHTDVPTPQTGPKAFASTTQVADAMRTLVGESSGHWRIRSYNLKADPRDEHISALTEWGPEFVESALPLWLSQIAGPKQPDTTRPPPPHEDDTLDIGLRVVAWAEMMRDSGLKEWPAGSNGGAEIAKLLAPCRRRDTGKLLGLKSGNWCAAFVSAAQQACLKEEELASHGYRISCVELQADLMENGLWRPSSDVQNGFYVPQVGDLAILDRSVPGKPETAWWRHVCLVRDYRHGGTLQTIGGNEGGMVSVTNRSAGDPKLLGFGSRKRRPATGITAELKLAVEASITMALDELIKGAIKT